MIPLCGHPARPPLEILISYSTRTVARCGLFQAVVPQSFAAVWCGRNIVPPMRLRRGQTRGYISAGKLFRQELVSKSLSARVCQQGRLAQLVERLLYTQKVGGSRPSPPTNLRSLRKLRVAQLSGKGIESPRNRRIGLGIFSDRTISSRKLAKQNARRRGNLLRRRTGGERREIPNFESLLGGDQIASLSSFEARKATFLLALI